MNQPASRRLAPWLLGLLVLALSACGVTDTTEPDPTQVVEDPLMTWGEFKTRMEASYLELAGAYDAMDYDERLYDAEDSFYELMDFVYDGYYREEFRVAIEPAAAVADYPLPRGSYRFDTYEWEYVVDGGDVPEPYDLQLLGTDDSEFSTILVDWDHGENAPVILDVNGETVEQATFARAVFLEQGNEIGSWELEASWKDDQTGACYPDAPRFDVLTERLAFGDWTRDMTVTDAEEGSSMEFAFGYEDVSGTMYASADSSVLADAYYECESADNRYSTYTFGLEIERADGAGGYEITLDDVKWGGYDWMVRADVAGAYAFDGRTAAKLSGIITDDQGQMSELTFRDATVDLRDAYQAAPQMVGTMFVVMEAWDIYYDLYPSTGGYYGPN